MLPLMDLRRTTGRCSHAMGTARTNLDQPTALIISDDSEFSRANKTLEREATLGRYMLEMRHTMNNALTSVLGNSELLLIEPGSLSAAGRSQLETIRNMAVRLHEILQRFSSIEKEMSVIEKQAQKDAPMRTQAAATN